jgi:hypothetical protein
VSARLRVREGGEGEALRLEGEVLHTVIDRAFAPGAPLGITLAVGDASLALAVKTIGSKRRDDGRFDVRLRLTNVRREEREILKAI